MLKFRNSLMNSLMTTGVEATDQGTSEADDDDGMEDPSVAFGHNFDEKLRAFIALEHGRDGL